MVYDFTKLRAKISKNFGKQENFAKCLDITRPALTMKLCGRRPFTVGEIETCLTLLGITRYEIPEYFFTPAVQESEQNG